MVQKIKEEKPTTDEESDSESDIPSTPLAASTQRTSPLKTERQQQDDESGSDPSGSSGEDSEDYQPATQERIVSPEPETFSSGVGGASMEKYLSKFPHVRPSKPKYSVDVDLTDPDDEVWIVQCPASMDAKKVLASAKFEDCRYGQAAKIRTSQKGQQQIEGLVVENTNRKPVIIMSGKEFKSFVPEGTIQIRETLNANSIKLEAPVQIPEDEDDSVPYPENLRDRHPLLGLNYKAALKLPKKVKKSLSLAQQRAEACYLEQQQKQQKEEKSSSTSKKNKRKRRESEDEMLPVAEIKQEQQDVVPSPARKKVKKEKKDKKAATVVEDDLSWLHNI